MSFALENAIWSFVAGCVSIWAAYYSPKLMRWVFAICALLAFFYSGAYLWLAFHLDRQGEWSRFIIQFGRLSWIVAWVAVPVGYVQSQKRTARHITRQAERFAAKVRPDQ